MPPLLITQRIDTLEEIHENEFLNPALASYLPSEKSKGLLYEQHYNRIARIVDGSKDLEESVYALESFSNYYLYYVHYLVKNEEHNKVADAFAHSARYGYYAIKTAYGFQSRFEEPVKISQTQIVKYWSLIIQCGWWPEMKEIGAIIRAQFDPESELSKRIIAPDDEGMNKQLWFLLSQFNHIIDSPLDNEQLDLPELLYPYDEVVQIWDTQDKDELNKWVYILCEEHLSLTDEGEIFSPITSQLFPYTILAWLAIRKRKGLKNPKRFEHALMQQPLAKLFKDSLPKPDCEGALLLLQKLNNDRNNIAETT